MGVSVCMPFVALVCDVDSKTYKFTGQKQVHHSFELEHEKHTRLVNWNPGRTRPAEV